jgi:hypothetical protein
MAKLSVLIHGATGETGRDILTGLLDDGDYVCLPHASFQFFFYRLTWQQEIACLVRPQSLEKGTTQTLKDRNLKLVVADLAEITVDELAKLITGYDIVVSAIAAEAQLDQLILVDAAAKAGTKRFVPCGWTTVAPPGGVMHLRDEKETVYKRIWYHHLPYTIVDVGFWHQISWPKLSSGRLDYAILMPGSTIFGDGNAPNILTDKRDIGRFAARIFKDDRTLNRKVFTAGDSLSQNEIFSLLEEKSGEKIPRTYVSGDSQVRSYGISAANLQIAIG